MIGSKIALKDTKNLLINTENQNRTPPVFAQKKNCKALLYSS